MKRRTLLGAILSTLLSVPVVAAPTTARTLRGNTRYTGAIDELGWFAPAGIERGNVHVYKTYTDASNYERVEVAPNVLNIVNEKRVADMISKETRHIHRDLMHWLSYEPVDQISRNSMRVVMEDYMLNMKNKGAIKRFEVTCDDSNNPLTVQRNKNIAVTVFWEQSNTMYSITHV